MDKAEEKKGVWAEYLWLCGFLSDVCNIDAGGDYADEQIDFDKLGEYTDKLKAMLDQARREEREKLHNKAILVSNSLELSPDLNIDRQRIMDLVGEILKT